VPPLADAPLALAVKGGAQTDVLLDYSAVPERLLLQKGQGKSLSAALALPARLDAPVAAQSEVGRVSIYSGETLLGEYPVKAAQSVEKLDVGGALRLLLESLAET
jgi:D-alanyl-D-alanine carboxypeptidase (penicillin-binding protein 5/6)